VAKVRNFFPVVVAVGSGVITLTFFFLRDYEFVGDGFPLILRWVTTLTAFALLVGITNLFLVHIRKVSAFSSGWGYSIVVVLGYIFVFGMWLMSAVVKFLVDYQFVSTENETIAGLMNLGQQTVDFMFAYVQTPVEATLSAMLAVILILAGARLIRKQRNWTAALFVIISVALLISLAPIGMFSFLTNIRALFIDTVALGAMRGIILGVALGVIATGLRVIVGVDHPYGD